MAPNYSQNVFFVAAVIVGISTVVWWVTPDAEVISDQPAAFAGRNALFEESGSDADAVPLITRQDEGLKSINAAFENDWKRAGCQVAASATPLKTMRRLTLALCGRTPSLHEIRKFQRIDHDQQTDRWVSYLLSQKQSSNFLAERLARALVGVEEGPFLIYRRRRFVNWLSEQISANRPYDQIVRSLLDSDGTWTDSPSVNFYTRTIVGEEENAAPDPVVMAGRVTRALIAMRIDCLQCHDDFTDEIYLGSPEEQRTGVQSDFHHLAAFFSQTRNSFFGIGDHHATDEPYRHQLLGWENELVISPKVPYAPHLIPADGTLRERLASWVTHRENRPFARGIVNRMWAIMTGKPLVYPVDNLPLNGPFPMAMETLATDFIEHDFNLHRLIHIIAASDAFAKDSSGSFEITKQHTDLFAVFPMTRLRPDQVAGAVLQATSMTPVNQEVGVLSRLESLDHIRNFVKRFGDPGENEFEHRGETVTQKLLMFNGKMVTQRLNKNSPIGNIHWLSPDDATTLESIFLTALTRRPTVIERDFFLKQLSDTKADKQQVVSDVYWSLINSLEFAWNH